MSANATYPGYNIVTFPTASCSITINEPLRSLGSVLTLEQLDALDYAETKEAE